jgi:uncharacterized protein DUF3995
MKSVLSTVLTSVFVLLAFVHVYWALGGSSGKSAVVPHIHGAPAFRPSSSGTLLVAIALMLCALLIASVSGLFPVPVPIPLLAWFTYGLAAALLLRAIGDFRLVGFFKRERGGRFAHLDTFVFSPLCFLLAVGVFIVGYTHVA